VRTLGAFPVQVCPHTLREIPYARNPALSSVGTSPDLSRTSKQHQLRALNDKYRDRQAALNQALHSITRALQLEEQAYQHERLQIINSPYYGS